jgi:hypothetical protein
MIFSSSARCLFFQERIAFLTSAMALASAIAAITAAHRIDTRVAISHHLGYILCCGCEHGAASFATSTHLPFVAPLRRAVPSVADSGLSWWAFPQNDRPRRRHLASSMASSRANLVNTATYCSPSIRVRAPRLALRPPGKCRADHVILWKLPNVVGVPKTGTRFGSFGVF